MAKSRKNNNQFLTTLDMTYIMVTLFLLVAVAVERNILDMMYLGILTFYYIKIKIYRSKK